MSQKSVKAARKEEKLKKEDAAKRVQEFQKEANKLSEKYRVDIVPRLQYGANAIVPILVAIDVKDKYEQITEEAKRAEAEKKSENGESKTPKLEL